MQFVSDLHLPKYSRVPHALAVRLFTRLGETAHGAFRRDSFFIMLK